MFQKLAREFNLLIYLYLIFLEIFIFLLYLLLFSFQKKTPTTKRQRGFSIP